VADLLKPGVYVPLAIETNRAFPVRATGQDLGLQATGKANALTDPHLSPGMDKRLPTQVVVGDGPQKEHLDASTQVLVPLRVALADWEGAYAGPEPVEPRGEHPGVVQNQAISRAEESSQVAELTVLPSQLVAVQDKHARGGTVLQRLLCDLLLRQVIIKIRELHGPRESE
jgi:hypothetical protein